MGKQKDRMEVLRLGSFIADGILDKDGHTTFIEIRTASGNWKMRFDESTWMFGIMKTVFGMNPDKKDTKQWMNYLHAVTNILYEFGTCGIPIEILPKLDKLIMDYIDEISKNAKQPTDSEEKETLDDMKREYDMRDELKNIDKNGN